MRATGGAKQDLIVLSCLHSVSRIDGWPMAMHFTVGERIV